MTENRIKTWYTRRFRPGKGGKHYDWGDQMESFRDYKPKNAAVQAAEDFDEQHDIKHGTRVMFIEVRAEDEPSGESEDFVVYGNITVDYSPEPIGDLSDELIQNLTAQQRDEGRRGI